jgi:hypothetical protein
LAVCSKCMGSSLSASFNFQWPVRSTPDGGAKLNLSLAQALKTMIAAITANRMMDPLGLKGIL